MNKFKAAANKIRAWRENPAQFAHEVFKFEPDQWQLDALKAMGGGTNPQRRVCMKACTGPGKTALLAVAGWHRLLCFAAPGEHPKGAALSITRDNLRDNLWPEMAKWQARSEFLKSSFTWGKEQIFANDHPETWFLSARSFSKDADADGIGRALSGLHSQFPFILLDEIGDMPLSVGRAAEQAFTGSPIDAAIIAAGNPTSLEGLLYHICRTLGSRWVVITITADPADPKRTPRVPIEFAQQQIDDYGRENPWVMATILGLFPPAPFNALVGINDMEAAMSRVYKPGHYRDDPKVIGVDVAREGDDRSVIARRQGQSAFEPRIYRNLTSTELAGHTARERREWQADGIIVDGTGGYGGGVIDALRSMNIDSFNCQFAGKPFNPMFANKRAEIGWAFAEWIKGGGALPKLPDLISEATAITYTYHGDKLILAPKIEIKKKLGRSPDLWDAYAVTFAFPVEKALDQIFDRHNAVANNKYDILPKRR